MKEFDFAVIGSGIAGLTFALQAARHGTVAVVTKSEANETNTLYAQGGIASVTSGEDSFDLHVRDTLVAGDGLCHEDAVRIIVSEGPERIAELVAMGVPFDRRESFPAELDLTREGGHSKRRILHAQDATGRAVQQTLLDRVAEEPNITVLSNHMAIDLVTTGKLGLTTEDRCIGFYMLDTATGQVEILRSHRVVLASGGCGRVYLYTTNPDVAVGDGVAMAWRAGATIANMEFMQFHPTCLYHPAAKSFLITEAVRGEGGILLGQDQQPFMHKYDPRKELAPRDIVARAIDAEMKRTGSQCVFLDISHKSPDFILKHFPNIQQTCLACGIDITKQPIPVVPAAHYMCGGVQTDVNGFTGIRGLFAIGEVACTGLHGANRLASNSLLEGLVTGHRAFQTLLRDEPLLQHQPPGPGSPPHPTQLPIPPWTSGNAVDIDELVVIYHIWDEIRRLMWDYVGIVRTDKRLRRASSRLRNIMREIQEYYWDFKVRPDLLELRNLATVASLIVDSALLRHESRGLHYTLDHPKKDNAFLRDTLLRRF